MSGSGRCRRQAAGLALAALAAGAGCGLTLTGGIAGYVLTQDDDDKTPPNAPPLGTIETPLGLVNDVIAVNYVVVDAEADPVNIAVRFSTDGGATWSAALATAASGQTGHDGVSGLATSPAGTAHRFLWNSFADLRTAGLADTFPTVRVRVDVAQADGRGGTVLTTGTFAVWNRYTATVVGTAEAAQLSGIVAPAGLARFADGDLCVADLLGHKVLRMDGVTGALTIVAGTGSQGFNGDNQPATQARLAYPADVDVDAAGHIFIADAGNSAIRRVDALTGFITTVAGNGAPGSGGDGGSPTAAGLAGPEALDLDAAGNLWIADTGNHRIRFVNRGTTQVDFVYWNGVATVTTPVPANTIETVAGGGVVVALEGISPLAARIQGPRGVRAIEFPSGGATLSLGFVFSDTDADRVRMVSTLGTPGTTTFGFFGTNVLCGTIRTVAGGAATVPVGGGVGDGGAPTGAILDHPGRLDLFYFFGLWIADTNQNRIRVAFGAGPPGLIFTYAGSGGFGYAGDGRAAGLANLAIPIGVRIDSSINTYIGDTLNGRVRIVAPIPWAGVWARTAADVTAVGSTGHALRFDGTQFRTEAAGIPEMLAGVSGTGANDIVGVGVGGQIVRFSGTAWAAESSGTTQALQDVFALTASDQVAVGSGGTILRYNGSAWAAQTSGTTQDLFGVWANSATDIWAAGGGPSVLHLGAVGGWQAQTLPASVTATLNAVTGRGSDVTVVGNGGTFATWNGSAWTDRSSALATAWGGAGTPPDLSDVWAASATRVIAVGNSGFMVEYDPTSGAGGTFTFPTSGVTTDLYAVHGFVGGSTTDVFAVGENDVVLHDAGTGYVALVPRSEIVYAAESVLAGEIESLNAPPVTALVAVRAPGGVAIAANGDAYCASSGTNQVLHLDAPTRLLRVVAGTGTGGFGGDGGAAGPATALTTATLHGTWGANASDVWAVGEGGVMVRWNGTAWGLVPSGVTTDLSGVHGTGAADVWVVGDAGTILHWDGTAWSPRSSPSPLDLHAVCAISTTDAFAVGEGGIILRLVNGLWTIAAGGGGSSTSGPILEFFGVYGANGSDVWAVGSGSANPSQGPIWHWNGTAWSLATLPAAPGPTVGVRAVHGFSASDVYAVGEQGTVYHWNGSAWSAESSAVASEQQCVFGRSATDVFTAGNSGQGQSGTGSNSWTAFGVNLLTSVHFAGGVAFPAAGPLPANAFLVGDDGTIYRQTTPGGPWVLQHGQGRLFAPAGLALSNSGQVLFVADAGNDRLRAVNVGSGTATIYPSASGPGAPIVLAPGAIATVVGSTNSPALTYPHGDTGFALAAELDGPTDVAVHPVSGDLYIADNNHHRIRVVNASTGIIATYAGSTGAGSTGDTGAATSAFLNQPYGITLHQVGAGNVEGYIADTGNHRVRVVNNAGNINAFAGTGVGGFGTDGVARTSAQLNSPTKVVVVGTTVYIADATNNRIRQTGTGAGALISTVAGTGQAAYGGDPKPATFATLNQPRHLAWDASSGTLFLTDTGNDRVRRFRP